MNLRFDPGPNAAPSNCAELGSSHCCFPSMSLSQKNSCQPGTGCHDVTKLDAVHVSSHCDPPESGVARPMLERTASHLARRPVQQRWARQLSMARDRVQPVRLLTCSRYSPFRPDGPCSGVGHSASSSSGGSVCLGTREFSRCAGANEQASPQCTIKTLCIRLCCRHKHAPHAQMSSSTQVIYTAPHHV